MGILFSNDTQTEKVAAFAAFESESAKARLKFISRASIAAAFALMLVIVSPIGGKVKWLLIGILIAMMIAFIVVCIKRTKPRRTGTTADMGFVTTGENDKYHYDFYEEKVAVSGASECEIPFSEFLSVHDIGSAFQFRTSERSYTVKKSGFHKDDIKRFKDLMIVNGIKII